MNHPARQPLPASPRPAARGLRLAAALVLALQATAVPARADEATLRIATWNLQWLVAPSTAHAARLACRARHRAAVPCNALHELDRDSADLARLGAYARALDADVVALQEVEDAAAARQVFRGYALCVATGRGVQHVGFAVRPSLPHRCGPQVGALAAGGGRPGLELHLAPRGTPPLALLAVHLKSGCATEPLDAPRAACVLLSRQAAALGAWIAARRGERFIVLGDFNRRADRAQDHAFWQQLHPEDWIAPTQRAAFRNCVRGQPFGGYIDHVLVSRALQDTLRATAVEHVPYAARDVMHYRLSDHCPVRVSLKFPRAL